MLPYLQQYLSLEERGSIDILEEGTKEVSSGKESKAVIPTKPAKEKRLMRFQRNPSMPGYRKRKMNSQKAGKR